jgi:hypothetical protein
MFHFTIRDMLWMTVLVAVTLSWALDRTKLTTAIRELSKQRAAEQRFARLRDRELKGIAIIDILP